MSLLASHVFVPGIAPRERCCRGRRGADRSLLKNETETP